MEIRKATIDDLQEIQRLNLLLFKKEAKEYDSTLNTDWTFSEPGKKYYTDKIKDKKSLALIAEEKDKIVGYLVGGIRKVHNYRNIKLMTELENMLVLEGYRSKGIGLSLMKEFVKWSEELGVSRIHVEASAANLGAINFYKKNGFKECNLSLELEL